uniref:Uncharacterized protein n=1 Tax=Arion vulgaris TaxID=1028688 RepID=A0A0B7AEL8_9EUPU
MNFSEKTYNNNKNTKVSLFKQYILSSQMLKFQNGRRFVTANKKAVPDSLVQDNTKYSHLLIFNFILDKLSAN